MSVLKPLDRFIICYKKEVDGNFEKKIQIITASDEATATSKVSDRFDIPNNKIARNVQREGWLYCNPIYNPNNEDIIAQQKENEVEQGT